MSDEGKVAERPRLVLDNNYKYCDPDSLGAVLAYTNSSDSRFIITTYDLQMRPSGSDADDQHDVLRVATASIALTATGAKGLRDSLTELINRFETLQQQETPEVSDDV